MLSVKDSRISPSNRMSGEYNARSIETAVNSHRTHRELTEGMGNYDAEEDYTVIDGGRIDGTIDWM